MKTDTQLTHIFKVNKPFLHKWRPTVSFGLIPLNSKILLQKGSHQKTFYADLNWGLCAGKDSCCHHKPCYQCMEFSPFQRLWAYL